MSKQLRELEIQEANALSMAQYFRSQIRRLGKPVKKADPKIIAAKLRADKNSLKRYG